MKRIKSYQNFKETRPIKEEFIGKMFRSITGADKREINSGVRKLQSIYNKLNDSEKKEFIYTLNNNYLNEYSKKIIYSTKEPIMLSKYKDAFSKILDSEDWHSIVNPSSDDSQYLISIINKINKTITEEISDIKGKASKKELNKKVEDFNKEVDKFNRIVDSIKSGLYQKPEYWEELFGCIPGSPIYKQLSISKFLDKIPAYTGKQLFLETGEFKKFEEWVNELNGELKESNYKDFYNKLKTTFNELWDKVKGTNDARYVNKVYDKLDYLYKFNEVLQWVKSELKDKKVSDIALSIINSFQKERIVEIINSDSKEAKTEGDKLVAGNIVYSGQNFNNLNKDNISRFINKEGYKETYSGKGIFTTNNIPYAFYYCHLRFKLEDQKVTDTLFPTIYKITLKPGTKFFHKLDTDIDDNDKKLAIMCDMAGYHSGNNIVNRQSVEISIVNPDFIESIEPISPQDLIKYLDSPELTKDNSWIETDKFKVSQDVINWYKRLVSDYIK
jgi:hypothetical protein